MKKTFIEICAGIGGFRVGLEAAGWECIHSNEIDTECEKTYASNFGGNFDSHNLLELDPNSIPDALMICAGFPCQPFSIAGKQEAFNDERARILPKIIEIVRYKKPPLLLLENVSNFARMNHGFYLKELISTLQSLSYEVHIDFLNSKNYGVPQSRERVFILAMRKDISNPLFSFTQCRGNKKSIREIIVKGDDSIPISRKWHQYIDFYQGKLSQNDLNFALPKTRIKLERSDVNADLADCVLQIRSSGIRAISIDNVFPTFAVSHSGGGAMIPVYTAERRHLSLSEIKRIMGFSDSFNFPVSRTHAIKQLSNAVCPPVINSIAIDIESVLL